MVKKQLSVFLVTGLVILLVVQNQAFAQTNESRYGEDSATCVMKISLYREFFKQWKGSSYTNHSVYDALTHWRWVFMHCPRGTENTYVDGTKIFDFLIKKEKDEVKKEKYIDTLMMIYDQRIEYFPLHYKTGKSQVGDILGRKGVDLYQLRPNAIEEVYSILRESVELTGNESEAAVLVYYFRIATKMVDEGKIGKDILVDAYDKIMEIIEYNLKHNPAAKEDFENTKGNIELTFEPYATCTDLLGIYRKKFNEQGDDVAVLRKIILMLDKKGCTEDELYFEATVKLYGLEPDPVSAFLIGKMYIKKKDFSKAIGYLKEAVVMEDNNARADCYLLLAESCRNEGDFPTSRMYAYKAAELRPTDGNPYIIIGNLYAASAKDCGDNDLTQKAAYWAAVDKYYRARSIDPSLSAIADELISAYSKAFPSLERIFFHDLKEGDSFYVECWINETTTVRAAK